MGLMDLFRPKWNHPEWRVREEAVGKLIDQAVLAEIARADEDESVRRAAVSKLQDQALLAQIAKRDKSNWVRELAVMKLEDQALLAECARDKEYWGVRMYAVEKLEDQAFQFALGELVAHLNYLCLRGQVRRDVQSDGSWLFMILQSA